MNFVKYFLSRFVNWAWTIGSIVFIVLFLHGNAPVFCYMAFVPSAMLVYNIVDEANNFYGWNKSRQIAYFFYGACIIDIFIIISRLIF